LARKGGDLPPRKGDIFQSKIVELLCDLGYEEKTRRRFGLDFIADSPPEQIRMSSSGLPAKTFLRPLFSPKGTTAFEFRGGEHLQLKEAAKELSEKIGKVSSNDEIPLKNIAGGVIVKDIKVPTREIKKTLDTHEIHVWDTNILSILASKVFTKKSWEKAGIIILEEKLDEWTTVLRCAGTYRNCLRFKTAIFYQNPFEVLDLDKMRGILKLLTRRVQDITTDTTLATYVRLDVHSLSGTTEELDENFHKTIMKHDQGRIKYEVQEALLRGYDIAPWHNFLSALGS